jgi:hypothetical protein
VRRRNGAIAARAGAVALPLGAATLLSSIDLFVLPTPTEGWQFAWWTCVILSSCLVALACEPLTRRLWTFAILLELEAQFPRRAPARLMVALHASGTAALQLRLLVTAHDKDSDDVMTSRMATAAALGALRVQRLRDTHRARLPSTVVLAACAAFVAVLVSSGTARESTHESAEAPVPGARVPTHHAPRAASPAATSPPVTQIPRSAQSSGTGASAPADHESTAPALVAQVPSPRPSPPLPAASRSSSPEMVDATESSPMPAAAHPVSSESDHSSASITSADPDVGETTSADRPAVATPPTSSVPLPTAVPSLGVQWQRSRGTIADPAEPPRGEAEREPCSSSLYPAAEKP